MPKIYQLKVSLKRCSPPIWRRIVVDSKIKLPALHMVLQVAMGWTNSHLHAFEMSRHEIYASPDPDFDDGEFKDETKVSLDRLLQGEGDSLTYEYDFGDSWEHKVSLEKVLASPEALRTPMCLTGKNACPPEDCGGAYGYAHIVGALADTAHPEHEEMKEYFGEQLADNQFDIEAVNRQLSAIFLK